MCAAIYTEPVLSILVLDYLKEVETRLCLESIKRHVKVPYKVIYHHNGEADYPVLLLKEGLVDHLIQSKTNAGLGIGTRNLFAASFSPYSLYLQNDQYLHSDLTEEVFSYLIGMLGGKMMLVTKDAPDPQDSGWTITSISLAGQPCGPSVYSERAHLVPTAFYKSMEANGLPYHGAGPYHDGQWREATIQKLYEENRFIHATHLTPMVTDNGRRALRENPDGSKWLHFPDTKQCWLLEGPVKERHVYPRFTESEWNEVLATQTWPAGLIPEQERKESFHVWN